MIRFLLPLIVVSPAAFADPLAMRVYDGDTVAPTIRLTIDGENSFDTPETAKRHGADCDLEIERGKAAKARLREIVREAETVSMIPLIDEETGEIARTTDRRRMLFRMLIDGENIGRILTREGHAKLYLWRSETIDWCAETPVVMPK